MILSDTNHANYASYASYSSSSVSSASYSNDWEHSPIVVGRVECFKTNTFHHIENRNPHLIAHEITQFILERNIEDVRVTINDIRVPLPIGNHQNIIKTTFGNQSIYQNIIKTIENEKHFFREEDFFI